MIPKRAIVVGGTSGIGLEIVRQLLANGCMVVAIGRNFDQLEGSGAICVLHELANHEEVPRVFISATDMLGGLDLFVYSAGLMRVIERHEFDSVKDLEMIAVNVTGAVAWMNEAAARFHGAERGCLMAIGSVAGDRGRAGQPVYNASKAFLHTYTESLRNRLAKRGVSVVTIKPGPTRTPMTAYHDQSRMMDPAVVAKRALRKVGRQGEFYVHPVHCIVGFVFRHMPGWLMRRVKI